MTETRSAGARRMRAPVAIAAALLSLVLASAAQASSSVRVEMRDDCDPVTFNAALGPGACVGNGGTTLQEVNAQLADKGAAGAWKFSRDAFTIDAGTPITVVTTGGEFHTFTRVAAFGGGCVKPINDLIGLSPVPECAGAPAILGATGARPGQSFTIAGLAAGTYRYECLIHPWMRSTVTVRRR